MVPLIWAFAAIGVLGSALALSLLATVCVLRPWDGCTTRTHSYVHGAPYGVFWLNSWIIWAAEMVVSLKPAPMRVAELGSAFTQSQVLFALSNLGIPDLLFAADGPQSAPQLAGALAAQGKQVPPSWLERLLAASAAMGMIKRSMPQADSWLRRAAATHSSTTARLDSCSGEADSHGAVATIILKPSGPQSGSKKQLSAAKPGTAAADTTTTSRDELPPPTSCASYALNAVSAALVSSAACCMSSFVKLLEDDYAAMTHLTQGLVTNTVPFELWSGGQAFWQHLAGSERYAATFDVAMQQKRHIGGTALVKGFPFGMFDTIIDVAGGVGAFTADVMVQHPQLKGVVLDQEQQIARGQEIWANYPQALSSRVTFRAGDIFTSSTIPAPQGKTAYVLYDILHNWADPEAVRILRAIREAVARGGSSIHTTSLLILETTKAEEVLPCHMPFRCGSDVAMLTLFGDGKERDSAQFQALLAASGWSMSRLVPTSGIFMVLEAVPADTV